MALHLFDALLWLHQTLFFEWLLPQLQGRIPFLSRCRACYHGIIVDYSSAHCSTSSLLAAARTTTATCAAGEHGQLSSVATALHFLFTVLGCVFSYLHVLCLLVKLFDGVKFVVNIPHNLRARRVRIVSAFVPSLRF